MSDELKSFTVTLIEKATKTYSVQAMDQDSAIDIALVLKRQQQNDGRYFPIHRAFIEVTPPHDEVGLND